MENLAKACLDYATPLMTVPKIYTFGDYAAAVAFMVFSVIGMIWCMHKFVEFVVLWLIPATGRLYWRAKEAYLFWRYPEPTPEQERAIWTDYDVADYDARVRRDAEIIRRNADHW